MLHPDVTRQVVETPLNHLSLSRSLSEVTDHGALRDAAGAPSLLEAFGLDVGPRDAGP